MGITRGDILVSYDVSDKNQEVKDTLINLGYFDYFTLRNGSVGPYLLPNTTLWSPQRTSDQAMQDMKNVCQYLQVSLTRAVAVLADEFVGL